MVLASHFTQSSAVSPCSKFPIHHPIRDLNSNNYSSGFQLWKIYLALDSDRYPMKSYADPFFRIYGRWARHGVNILQSVQLLLTVSALILGNGQSISQVSKGTICFIACLIIFMAAGMVLGQIRTLQRFGWLANFAVWLNLLILFIWSVLHHPLYPSSNNLQAWA